MAGPCPPLGRAPELCQLCGWALWLGLVLLLAAPLSSVNSLWLGLVLLWLGLVLLLSSSWPLNSVNSVAGLCVQALSSSWPPLNPVNSVAGLCVQALSSSWLCRALFPGPPVILPLAAPLNSVNSVAGLRGWALCPGLVLLFSSSWPRPSTLSTLWPWLSSVSARPLTYAPEGRAQSALSERKTQKDKLKEKEERERERERERQKETDSRASARALVCYGRRAHAPEGHA